MSEGTRPRLLIVDDERLLVESLSELLSDDFDVISAGTVADGVERVRAEPTLRAILCDLHLLDGTGLDLHRGVREVAPGAERRMVFFTGGNTSAELTMKLRQTGCPCLSKPFDFEALVTMLRRIAAG
jgi:two-component system cell cycle sensor histidine kinase/response regulator CckA